jgi:nucleotide-binding universal stress UspA family protein
MTIKRILVPMDFSLDADAALAYALELARQFSASVYLLHVLENPLAAGMWSSDAYTAELSGLSLNLVRDAEERLRQAIPTIAGVHYGLTSEVRVGKPADTIVAFAREQIIDLIVMGTTGRTGVPRILMGSVAERVVRTAPCPVLTMRAHERERAKVAVPA